MRRPANGSRRKSCSNRKKNVEHYHSIEKANLNTTWLTIGNFDGVHLGHQDLVSRVVEGAHRQCSLAVVLTFHPHPAEVLGRRQGSFYLTTPEERAEILGSLGVDVVITQPFNHDLAQTPALEFIRRLHGRLHFSQLMIGHDFALGRGRDGNEAALREMGLQFGFQVQAVEAFSMDGEIVSSSHIRNLLAQGLLPEANRLLGRSYSLSGIVVPGDQRGRTIGVPTANIAPHHERLIPASGVYACRAWVEAPLEQKVVYKAAVNIGVRPTFDGNSQALHVEAHLLDFTGDLYGQTVYLEFIARLRGEQKFGSIQDLVAQIRKDIAVTRELA